MDRPPAARWREGHEDKGCGCASRPARRLRGRGGTDEAGGGGGGSGRPWSRPPRTRTRGREGVGDCAPSLRRLRRRGGDGDIWTTRSPRSLGGTATWTAQPTRFPRSGGFGDADGVLPLLPWHSGDVDGAAADALPWLRRLQRQLERLPLLRRLRRRYGDGNGTDRALPLLPHRGGDGDSTDANLSLLWLF